MSPTAQERDYKELSAQWLTMLAGPLIWAIYFLIGYTLAEFGCRSGLLAGRVAGLPLASIVVVALTILALAASSFAGLKTYRRWRADSRASDASLARSEHRDHFINLTGLLLSVMFTFLVLATGIPALVLQPCAQ